MVFQDPISSLNPRRRVLDSVMEPLAIWGIGTKEERRAKASETLSGPRVAHVQHSFQLAVQVGDDGGAKHAWARLQVRGPHGGYQWLGGWHQLRSTGQQPPDWETYSFTVTENHPGTYTFRAVINTYPATSSTTVVVR